MAHYRRNHLDLSTRTQIVAEMLQPIPERKWGQVTEWARTYQVSRTLLYDLRDRATEALTESLLPRQPGPRPESSALVLDSAFIQQAVVILSVLKSSIRDIRRGLGLLFGVERSVGYISETLSIAGAQADAQNRAITVPLPLLGEADEIFQGRKPCLTVVDGCSFLVVNLTPTASRDSTTWGVTYLELAQRMRFQDLACDGGTGLQAGLREAELSIPLRPDLFHILQGSQRLTRRLEKAAYQAIATADRARRADQEERGILRRRRLKSQTPLAQAEAEETPAIAIFDNWCWLIHEIRQALANGGAGALLALGYALRPHPALFCAFIGAMATVNADTWATELGVLSRKPPRLITTGKPVERGTSGGVSLSGVLATLAGGALIGLAAAIFLALETFIRQITNTSPLFLTSYSLLLTPYSLLLIGAVSGLAGSLTDSFLGATVQAIYYSSLRQKETEKAVDPDGAPNQLLRGWRWLSNDWVNFISSCFGALVGALLWWALTR